MTVPIAPADRRKWPAEILTPDEVAAIIGACSAKSRTGIRNRAMITLLYKSGLRISEVIGYPGRDETQYTAPDGQVKTQKPRDPIPPLKEASIDFSQHAIRVLDTKSGKAQTRGFHPSADDTLHRWFDARRQLAGVNGRQPAFCALDGSPLAETYVRALLGRLKAKAGVEKRVHPHGFRHTFACELLFRGVDVVSISKLLGHSSVAVTQRYLDHLTNDQAIAKLVAVDWPDLEG
jgi:site-specific recombinase XerD